MDGEYTVYLLGLVDVSQIRVPSRRLGMSRAEPHQDQFVPGKSLGNLPGSTLPVEKSKGCDAG